MPDPEMQARLADALVGPIPPGYTAYPPRADIVICDTCIAAGENSNALIWRDEIASHEQRLHPKPAADLGQAMQTLRDSIRAAKAAAEGDSNDTEIEALQTVMASAELVADLITGPESAIDLKPCPGCKSAPGTPHAEGCDHARCPECGEQLMADDCETSVPAIWHGVDPRAEVAQRLDWWTTAVGIDHPVEDYTAVLIAAGRGAITWNRDTQRYDLPATVERPVY